MLVRQRPFQIVATLAIAAALVAAVALAQTARPAPAALAPTGLATVAPTPSITPVPTAAPVLRADGLATVAAASGVRVWSAPGDPKSKALEPLLPTGAVVFLTRGPQRVGGVDWWEIQPDYVTGVSLPFGWIRATGTMNQPTLLPFAPACPAVDVAVETRAIKALGTLQAVACFGGRELTVRGDLACYDAAVDSAVGGASWLSTNSACSMDETFWVEGPVVSGLLTGAPGPVVGHYELRGHFDDHEAAGCSWIPFGTSLLTPSGHPDPGAVIVCRQSFVVTRVTKLE